MLRERASSGRDGPVTDEAFVEELRLLVAAFPKPPETDEGTESSGGASSERKGGKRKTTLTPPPTAANRIGSVLARGSNLFLNRGGGGGRH